MRFDAYAGNVPKEKPVEVASVIAWACKCRVERGRPKARHNDVHDVFDGADRIGWVGYDQMQDTSYFEFKGERTPETSAAIRKHWKDHTASRLDACEDYNEPGVIDKLVAVMDASIDPRVIADMIAPRNGDRGRTFYYGSPQSRLRVRVYEAGKMKERLWLNKPDWARAEAQARPGKAAEKVLAATMTPLDVWGMAKWSQRAAQTLCNVEVARFAPESRLPEYDTTTLYLARAFRRHLQEMRDDFGSWREIGNEIESIWTKDDEAKRLSKRR